MSYRFCDPKSKDCVIFTDPLDNQVYLEGRTSEWDDYDDDFVYDRIYIGYCPWWKKGVKMTKNEINFLEELLHRVYKINAKYCDYDCRNCDYGILETYGDNFSCSLEFVINNISYDKRIRTNE